MEEYSADDDVSLLLVCRATNHATNDVIFSDFANIRNTVSKSDDELPHIVLYDKPIREYDMPRVYAAADAYVMPSRGEGFGFPYCESACCGLPVIGSYCTGQMDFLNDDNSYLIYPDGKIQSKITGSLSSLAKQCAFFEDQYFADFGRTGVEQTRARMREVQNNYEQAKQKASVLREQIVQKYNWETVIDRAYNRLAEIQ
jgi:glycosyltransferase involved in cell wall biosynthesis